MCGDPGFVVQAEVVPRMQHSDRQVCPLCGRDDEVVFEPGEDGTPVFVCRADAPRHPFEWRPPAASPQAYLQPRTGIGEELGIYDDLPTVLTADEPFVEYGVVEHRYAVEYPEPYRELVERYSHTSLEPKRYTASAFIAKALGTLAREGAVVVRFGVPATGRWAYNTTISAWARPGHGAEDSEDVLSWEAFATAHGIDPQTWPATRGMRPRP